MFKHILAPLDGSALAELVLPHIAAIAEPFQSNVTLLRVLDPVGVATRPRPVDPLDWQIRKAEAETYLRGLSNRFQEQNVPVYIEVREGKAADSVLDFARQTDADLIILCSHGQSGISGWNVSSVVQKVILRAQTSVMIVRAYRPPVSDIETMCYKRILLPLDGSQRAECVLPVASILTRHHHGEAIVVHVIEQPEFLRRIPPAQEDLELIEQIVERNRMETARYLEDVKIRLDVAADYRLFVHDSAGAALHQVVDQEQVDLVILSAHGCSGGTKWPYGSLVIGFIAYGTTPLLILQDLPRDRIEPSQAEMAAQEHWGR